MPSKKRILLYLFVNMNRYLTRRRRIEIARSLKLTERQIKVIKSCFFMLIYSFSLFRFGF
jgi:hypothetical protein